MNLRESLFRALDNLKESNLYEDLTPEHLDKLKAEYAKTGDRISTEHAMKMNSHLKKMPEHDLVKVHKHGIKWLSQSAGTQLMLKHGYDAKKLNAVKEETEHLDENAPQHVPGKKWDESKEKWVAAKRPAFDPKKERGRPSTPDQGQKRSDFDEEADLTKIDTKRLQSLVQMHKHYGQKNPASKAAADRGEAELKSRMNKEEVEGLDELSNTTMGSYLKQIQGNREAIRLKAAATDDPKEKERLLNKSMRKLGSITTAISRSSNRTAKELKAEQANEEVDLDEAVNEKQIKKDLDSGMSHDVVIGKHANKGTTNTDAIRKVIKQHAWDKRMKKESVEGLAEGRPSQAHPLAGHDYHKKSNDQLEYIRKDAHAAAEAMKDHNPTAENKYRDQASDASSVLHFRKTSGTPDWYKKKYGHIKESVDLDEAKTDVYHQHMLKALGKTKLPKDHPYTSAVANNGDFVVHNNGKVVGRIPKGEHSIKEESSLPPHLAKLIDPKTGNMKDPEKQKIYDDMMKRRQNLVKAKAKMSEETSSVAKDATVKSTKPNVTANTNTTTPYDVKPQRIKSAEFNKLHN